jgi:hypothetical protein
MAAAAVDMAAAAAAVDMVAVAAGFTAVVAVASTAVAAATWKEDSEAAVPVALVATQADSAATSAASREIEVRFQVAVLL